MKLFEETSDDIVLLTLSIVLVFFYPIVLERNISIEGADKEKYEKLFLEELETVKAERIEKGYLEEAVEEVVLVNPTDIEIAWINFAGKKDTFNGALPNLLQMKVENERYRKALKTHANNWVVVPMWGCIFFIFGRMTYWSFMRKRAEKSFVNRTIPAKAAGRLRLITKLRPKQQRLLVGLMYSMLNCREDLIAVRKGSLGNSARLNLLLQLLDSLLFDLYDAGVTQVEKVTSEHESLVKAFDLWKTHYKKECNAKIAKDDARLQSEREKLEVSRAQIDQEVEKRYKERISSASEEILGLQSELKVLNKTVKKMGTWNKQQRREKAELELRRRSLDERDRALGSRELQLSSRESVVKSQQRK